MSDYRRLYIPGGSYFFTVVTYERQYLFTTAQRVKELRQAFSYVKMRRPFAIVAAVVLPDHLHCLWQLPDGDCDFSTRWQMIKTEFSRRIPSPAGKDGAKTIWQPRFWEHRDSRRRGFSPSSRLHPLQSSEAWIGVRSCSMAVQLFSEIRQDALV